MHDVVRPLLQCGAPDGGHRDYDGPVSGTVLAVFPRIILAYLAARGLDPKVLAEEAGLGAMGPDDEDERVPRLAVDALWNLAAEKTGDPGIGVAFADAIPPGNAGVVEYVAQCAATVREAAAHVARYWRLANDGVEFQLSHDAERAQIAVVAKSPPPLAKPWLDLHACMFVLVGIRATGRPLVPIEVRMPWPRTSAVDPVEAKLGCPVVHDAEYFAVVFPASVLDVPLQSANATLEGLLRDHAEQKLAAFDAASSDDVVPHVRRAIRERLASGDANLERIAKALGTSARTLQRTMQRQGTSLRILVDEERKAIATRELASGSRSVTDLAFVLGFSETSAFDRAFRRWTGLAPREYRATARKSG